MNEQEPARGTVRALLIGGPAATDRGVPSGRSAREETSRPGGAGRQSAVRSVMRFALPVVALAAAPFVLGACALSRQAQLERKSEKVEGELRDEQRRVLSVMPPATPEREARLDHLTNLRATLSMANVALGAVPWTIPDPQRGTAYDVLDEVYETIRWNIPLGPEDAKRPMPAEFRSGRLDLNAGVR